MSICDRMREERERLGLSQTVLGQIGGVQKRAQINYESGERTPDATYLRAVAQVGVDVQYVLLGVRSANLDAVMISDEFVEETARERARSALLSGQSIEMLSAGERELLFFFRAAPLAVKASAIGALQGGSGAATKAHKQSIVSVGTNNGQQFNAPVSGGVAGRDIVRNTAKKEK